MRTICVTTLAVGWLIACGATTRVIAQAPVVPANGNDPVLYWNAVALQAVVDDHSGTYGPAEQAGPTRASRALAIVHLAVYDAVNAIVGGHEPFRQVTLPAETLDAASVNAAVAQAAHDALVTLYPNQTNAFGAHLQHALKGGQAKKGRDQGVQVGALAAAHILAARLNDGGDAPDLPWDSSIPKDIGVHREDPENAGQGLLTPEWGAVLPFAIDNVANFAAPAPPRPDSPDPAERAAYADAFNQVKALGGDGINTPTERTPQQTETGLFWAYDGSIGLGVPPCFYNQVVRVICRSKRNTVAENARLFALINMAQADAGIVSWYNKYLYNFWRPVIGVRCGHEDDNELTEGDAEWTPLGAPASNQSNGGIDFTPPFPAYTSGHATFGAATFRTLANFYGTDEYSFKLISGELSGRTTDSQGKHRHAVMRQFSSFSEAAWDNAISRIYLGIHWEFDAIWGVEGGNAIADYTFDNYLRPLE